jgi:hypothetical protein
LLLGNFQGAIVCAGAGSAANGQNALQAGFTGAIEHLSAVRIGFVALNVGVGIDVHEVSR